MDKYTLTDEHVRKLAKELEPCPFCGSHNVMPMTNPMTRTSIFCRGCGAQTKAYDTASEAIKHWNTRASIE